MKFWKETHKDSCGLLVSRVLRKETLVSEDGQETLSVVLELRDYMTN